MNTIKEFLNENNITATSGQRFDLGYRIARIWDSKRMGLKTYILEDDFKVRYYPKSFLYSKTIMKFTTKYFVDDFEKLSNTF